MQTIPVEYVYTQSEVEGVSHTKMINSTPVANFLNRHTQDTVITGFIDQGFSMFEELGKTGVMNIICTKAIVELPEYRLIVERHPSNGCIWVSINDRKWKFENVQIKAVKITHPNREAKSVFTIKENDNDVLNSSSFTSYILSCFLNRIHHWGD